MFDNIGSVDEKQKKMATMINHPIYGAYECEGGYRIFVKLYNTGEWQDCQALFGNGSLWITYPTEEEALAAARKVGRVRTANA
jgi:crotonobetainyl-CoA:carnitine CoA-transferase CaiB-like acyl-CoA transferase